MWLFDATSRRVPPLTGHASGRRMEAAITTGHRAPATARQVVADWLFGEVPDRLLADAQLLVSELVTNSVRHARLPRDAVIRVRVELSEGVVHVEVEDPGRVDATASLAPHRGETDGFGLYVVDTVAARWGSRLDGTTCVWAELPLSTAS
jgi:serine/threonine-protein kinase RsbW